MFVHLLRSLAAVAAVLSFALWPSSAAAAGIMQIQHSGGSIETYGDVRIQVLHGTLYVTSADGRGTLIIHRAACFREKTLMTCYPTSVSLVQSREVRPLDLKTGTVYVNDGDDAVALPLSTQKIPPHSIVMAMTTEIGTTVTLNGSIDKVVK